MTLIYIFFQHNNVSELTKIVNRELSFVATRFKANELTLHPNKTRFIKSLLEHRGEKNIKGFSKEELTIISFYRRV